MPTRFLTFAPMRGIYLQLKTVYIYTLKNTIFFFHVHETNFLTFFWLISVGNDFIHREEIFFFLKFRIVSISLGVGFI